MTHGFKPFRVFYVIVNFLSQAIFIFPFFNFISTHYYTHKLKKNIKKLDLKN